MGTSTNPNERKRTKIKRVRMENMRMTRRAYLTLKVMMAQPENPNPVAMQSFASNMFLATEAVASTAIEHPEWDMDEEREFVEWERG